MAIAASHRSGSSDRDSVAKLDRKFVSKEVINRRTESTDRDKLGGETGIKTPIAFRRREISFSGREAKVGIFRVRECARASSAITLVEVCRPGPVAYRLADEERTESWSKLNFHSAGIRFHYNIGTSGCVIPGIQSRRGYSIIDGTYPR